MRTEEENHLKDKQLSIPIVIVKANLIESIDVPKNRIKKDDKGKKFLKAGHPRKTTQFKGGNNKVKKFKLQCFCCGKQGNKAFQWFQRKNE